MLDKSNSISSSLTFLELGWAVVVVGAVVVVVEFGLLLPLVGVSLNNLDMLVLFALLLLLFRDDDWNCCCGCCCCCEFNNPRD